MTYAVLLTTTLVALALAMWWGQQAHEHAEETRQARGALAHERARNVKLNLQLLEAACVIAGMRQERDRVERTVLAEIDRDLTRLFGEGSA
jgi:hypothetical protein